MLWCRLNYCRDQNDDRKKKQEEKTRTDGESVSKVLVHCGLSSKAVSKVLRWTLENWTTSVAAFCLRSSRLALSSTLFCTVNASLVLCTFASIYEYGSSGPIYFLWA